MTIHRRALGAVAGFALLLAAPAAAAPVRSLPAPAIQPIPSTALRTSLMVDPNAPVARGEFATSIRVRGDRAALRAAIERERTLAAERFARGAGRAIVVPLRRSRY